MRNGNETSLAAIDQDAPDVDTMPDAGYAMAEVDPISELKKFEAAAELMTKLVPATIRVTKPQDWVEMGGKVYLQGTGVERMAPLWGLIFGRPEVERVDYPDGHFDFVVTGPAGSRRTGVYYRSVTGGRSSRDRFFWPRVDGDGKIETGERFDPSRHIDALDVRKAAITNWQCRSASMLAGMRGLTPADLKAAGIEGVASVQYQKGSQGGATVTADLKAEQVKLGNEVLERVGGDIESAKALMKSITAADGPGKDGKIFPGFDSASRLKFDWQIKNAWTKLREHPEFGDNVNTEEL